MWSRGNPVRLLKSFRTSSTVLFPTAFRVKSVPLDIYIIMMIHRDKVQVNVRARGWGWGGWLGWEGRGTLDNNGILISFNTYIIIIQLQYICNVKEEESYQKRSYPTATRQPNATSDTSTQAYGHISYIHVRPNMGNM